MQFDLPLPPLTLQCGVPLRGLHVRGWAVGPGCEPLAAHRVDGSGVVRRGAAELQRLWSGSVPALDPGVPTVLFVHALTGDAQAGGPGGWWEPIIGPGKVFDPTTTRLIGFNHLGSCYGSYGPADEGFPRWEDLPDPPETQNLPTPPAWRPAPITAWDQARVTVRALDQLGITTLQRVSGASVGGNLSLCIQALIPDRVGAVDAIACGARSTPWILGWNFLGRQAVLADPDAGLGLARAAAHLSYRSEAGLEVRQARHLRGEHPFAPYAMQTYLQHHGDKLRARFDPASYVSMLDAMDHHDVATVPRRDPSETWSDAAPWGLDRLHHVNGVGIDSDELFHPQHLRAVCEAVPGGTFETLHSPHGHDAFLMDFAGLAELMERHR